MVKRAVAQLENIFSVKMKTPTFILNSTDCKDSKKNVQTEINIKFLYFHPSKCKLRSNYVNTKKKKNIIANVSLVFHL